MPKLPKVEQPSKPYRTSNYTVRQFSALPYAERMAVDAACNATAAAKRALAEGGRSQAQTPESQAVGDPLTAIGSPTQSFPTQSKQLAMQLANTEFATEETTIEPITTPELVGSDDEEDDTEHAEQGAAPAPEPPAALLSYSADILTVVSEFVEMHENNSSAGWTHWGPTPLAEGRGVQFAINIHTNTFKCFVTQYSGSIVAFVGALKGITPPAALEWLEVNFPLPSDPEELLEQAQPAAATPAAVVPEAPTSVNSEIPESAPVADEAQPVQARPAPEPTHGAALDGTTYQTTDYDMFHLLPENRPVDLKHVRQLVAMITKSNLLHIKPLDVTTDMGVIDGQHRLEAARQMGLPVYYKIGEELSGANITTLNVAQKNWAGTDYLHYWTVKGKTDYVALTAFMKRHPKLSFSNAKMMLGETTKGNAEEFRAGLWKAGPAYKAEQVAEFIERLSVEVPTFKQPNHSGFVSAVFHCVNEVEKFQTKTFLERILKNPMMLVPCASHKQFMQVFDSVYNYRVNGDNRVNFL